MVAETAYFFFKDVQRLNAADVDDLAKRMSEMEKMMGELQTKICTCFNIASNTTTPVQPTD